MTNATGTDPDQTHADPAVQALIHDGWLGIWDYPTTVDDLVNAVALVRRTDLHAAGKLIRTEYAATTVMTDGTRNRTTTGTSRTVADVVIADLTRAMRGLGPKSPTAQWMAEHVVESREVWQLPDGCELTRPWTPVHADNPAKA